MKILEDEIERWQATIKGKGGTCPCCKRWGRINPRSINSTMARSLIWMFRAANAKGDPLSWIDVPSSAPRWVVKTNQLPSMRWWGLIERMPNDRPEVKHNGMWRLTERGYDFVMGAPAAAKVYVYDGEVVDVSAESRRISACLGKNFHYAEMMADNYEWGEAL